MAKESLLKLGSAQVEGARWTPSLNAFTAALNFVERELVPLAARSEQRLPKPLREERKRGYNHREESELTYEEDTPLSTVAMGWASFRVHFGTVPKTSPSPGYRTSIRSRLSDSTHSPPMNTFFSINSFAIFLDLLSMSCSEHETTMAHPLDRRPRVFRRVGS